MSIDLGIIPNKLDTLVLDWIGKYFLVASLDSPIIDSGTTSTPIHITGHYIHTKIRVLLAFIS